MHEIFVYCIVISLSSLNSLCDALRELDEDLDTDVSLRDSDEDEMFFRSVVVQHCSNVTLNSP